MSLRIMAVALIAITLFRILPQFTHFRGTPLDFVEIIPSILLLVVGYSLYVAGGKQSRSRRH